jgi:hypothetical protein
MRRLVPVLVAVLFLGSLSARENDSLRRVNLYLRPGVDSISAQRRLHELGFISDAAPSSGDRLSGVIAENKLNVLLSSGLVRRVAIGPGIADPMPRTPQQYKARIRYLIDADRNRHALEFRRMVAAMQAAGFVKDAGLEQEELYDDPISGMIPTTGLSRFLAAPFLQTVLLVPDGHSLPPGDQPVLVEASLTTRLGPTRQRELFEKTNAMLRPLGWVAAPGYDHRNFTRMLGWLPSQHLESVLLGTTTRDPQARRNLLVEMPLISGNDPFAVTGWVLVNVEIRFEPLDVREALLERLTRLGFEPESDEELREGLIGIVRGRAPTRVVERIRTLPDVRAVAVDRQNAVERLAPILALKVIPEPEGSQPPSPPPAERAASPTKLSVDLRRLLAEIGEVSDRLIRVEVLLRETPDEHDPRWLNALSEMRALMAFDGRIGPLVCGSILLADVKALAERPEVSTVRLPQMPWTADLAEVQDSGLAGVDFVPLFRQPALAQPLAALIRHRSPSRMAVVDVDFSGFASLVGQRLPVNTRLLDFTGERNPDLRPDPSPEGEGLGSGTRLALALAQEGADELLLIRIAPDAPYMLEQVARAMQGRGWRSDAVVRREAELRQENSRLQRERADLRVRRRLLLNDFRDDEETKAALEALQRAERNLESREQAFKERQSRFLQLVSQANQLRGIDTIVIGPLWLNGQPNLPELASRQRYLYQHHTVSRDRLPDVAWVQAVPRLRDSSWQDIFRDTDDDQAMDFLPQAGDSRFPKDLAWLAWKPNGSGPSDPDHPAHGAETVLQELPAGAVVQVTLQWREVHDPAYKQSWEEDPYRQPLANFRVVVLKQSDPAGRLGLPADLFVTAARSPDWVDRIDNDKRTAIYEATARFQVPEGGGRFAVRIEGSAPKSVLPPQAAPLPGEQQAETKPWIRVKVIDPIHRRQGQVLFESPAPDGDKLRP